MYYYSLSVQQKILVAIFIGVIGCAILMFTMASPILKFNPIEGSVDITPVKKTNNQNVLQENVHYGFVNLDSIKILTGQLPKFNNYSRIDISRIQNSASINVCGYEYMFFGKDEGKQWWKAYGDSLNSKGISYDEKEGKLTLKYKEGHILIPYQILMQLTLYVDKNNY